MTITIAVTMVSGRRSGLMQKPDAGVDLSTTGKAALSTFYRLFPEGIALIELLGAILLAPVFIKGL